MVDAAGEQVCLNVAWQEADAAWAEFYIGQVAALPHS
jgi:hypothetical protein